MNQTIKEMRNDYVTLLAGLQQKWAMIPTYQTERYHKSYDLMVEKIKALIRLTNDLIKYGERHG